MPVDLLVALAVPLFILALAAVVLACAARDARRARRRRGGDLHRADNAQVVPS